MAHRQKSGKVHRSFFDLKGHVKKGTPSWKLILWGVMRGCKGSVVVASISRPTKVLRRYTYGRVYVHTVCAWRYEPLHRVHLVLLFVVVDGRSPKVSFGACMVGALHAHVMSVHGGCVRATSGEITTFGSVTASVRAFLQLLLSNAHLH